MTEHPAAWKIKDWNELYETHETRKLVRLSWVPTPNKHDGNGYKRLMAQPEPGNLFTAFRLMVEVASKMDTRGVLEGDNGPLSPDDLAFMTSFPAEHFARAMSVLSDPQLKILWLVAPTSPEISRHPPELRGKPGESPGRMEWNGMEWNGMEGKRKNVSCAEPAKAPAPAPPIPPELQDLPLYREDKRLHRKWPELLPAWKAACPGIDVMAQVRRAHAWEVGNPQRRKRNRPRFLTNWMNSAQDAPRAQNESGRRADAPAPHTCQKCGKENVALTDGRCKPCYLDSATSTEKGKGDHGNAAVA